jgi:photoactive yellow protein
MKPGKHLFPNWEAMERVDEMSAGELDELPFGVIRLDAEGRISRYSAMESEISGRERDDVLGKDFFREIAPCTNVREFAGAFREGVANRDLNRVFPYLFDFGMRPTRVWVRMYFSERTESVWVFVTRQAEDE